MKRTIARAVSFLCALALLAAAATPASAAAPPGQGLVVFGPWQCDEPLGDVVLFGPSGFQAASVFTTTGQHLTLLSLDISGAFEFSKTYGQKSGLTTFTCTQSEAGVNATSVVGLVPPE